MKDDECYGYAKSDDADDPITCAGIVELALQDEDNGHALQYFL